MALIVLLLFVALLFLLAMLVLIFSTAASVMGSDRPVNPDDPTCGGCGYIVKNVQGLELKNVRINGKVVSEPAG